MNKIVKNGTIKEKKYFFYIFLYVIFKKREKNFKSLNIINEKLRNFLFFKALYMKITSFFFHKKFNAGSRKIICNEINIVENIIYSFLSLEDLE